MPIVGLLYIAWRLAPLLFAITYTWAVRSAMNVWDVIVTYDPRWSMPPELTWATAHLVIAALVSCAFWFLALVESDERHWAENLPFWLAMIPAVIITLVAGLLAFPFLLAAANQPSAYIPIAGVFLACPCWWGALQEAAQ